MEKPKKNKTHVKITISDSKQERKSQNFGQFRST